MENREIHIGHLIQQKLQEQGRSITWLAKQLNYSRANMYQIFNKKWIDTDLLLKICKTINYDFFKHYSSILNITNDVTQN